MATADRPNTDATISSEALSLLSCFSDGFDEVVWKIAEGIARGRTAPGVKPEIEDGDIVAAGEKLAHVLKMSPELPEDIKPAVDLMLQCVHRKAQSRKR